MAHDMVIPMREKKGSGKIRSIHIDVAENGYKYSVMTDKMDHADYVYETADSVVKALKDDLKSPHMRKEMKHSKGLEDEMARTMKKK